MAYVAKPKVKFYIGNIGYAVKRSLDINNIIIVLTIMQQHSVLLYVQHCDGSNMTDLSVQKVKLTGAHY